MSEQQTIRAAIHVVAGVICDGRRICITRRRKNVHQAGKWEFPGGKLEAGERPLDGLKRELREELGIEVERAEPFMQVRHPYPELDVLLDIWQVNHYAGVPRGHEGQEMRWADLASLDAADFPDADRPILRRLQLPSLYLLSDAQRFGLDGFASRLQVALAAGARLIQLREPQMDRASYCAYARDLVAQCHSFGARLLINADPDWLQACEADGVHLNSKRLMALDSRPLSAAHWVGASCHDVHELKHAGDLGIDFAVIGAVQPTRSHPGGRVLGWKMFSELCADANVPVYAIGGMTADDLPRARENGAHGLAMISGVWEAPDVETVVRRLS